MTSLILTDANDSLVVAAGYDIVDGKGGDDVIMALAATTIIGGSGNDTLYGGDGTLLVGGAGADSLFGSFGNVTADYSSSSAGVEIDLAATTGHFGDAEGDRLYGVKNVTGSNFEDTLRGDDGTNVLKGSGGSDVLDGRAGADVLDGGAGTDAADYRGSDAAVQVNLATGTGHGGTAEGDTLISIENVGGSSLNDKIIGTASVNMLWGMEGDDILIGGGGLDQLDGGDGVDTVDFSSSTKWVSIDLAGDLGLGGAAENVVIAHIENAIGTSYNDRLIGSRDANVLTGNGGDDVLDGGGGKDTLLGGAGNDRFVANDGAEIFDGGNGVDTVIYGAGYGGVTLSLVTGGTGGIAAGDSYVSIENVSGTVADDSITGDAQANRLTGGAGADTLNGGGGNDIISNGSGYDMVDGGTGIDTVDYSTSWDLVWVNLSTGKGSGAEAARDIIVNVENVVGSAFNDILTGDAQVNRLAGGDGNDTLIGNDGNDVLVGGGGADVMDGGLGDRDAADYQDAQGSVMVDLVAGGTYNEAEGDSYTGIEYVYGSSFTDLINGNDAVNRIVGNDGDDILDGLGGNDYIVGGAGDDEMTGGAGNDVFEVSGNSGTDAIWDFAAGIGRTDRVWFTDSSLTNFNDVLAHAHDTLFGVVIDIAGHGSIRLEDVKLASLAADDFIFG